MTRATWHEVSAADYDDALGQLPPIWTPHGFMVGEPSDHFGPGGAVRFAAYVRHGGRYYVASRALTVAEAKAWTPADLAPYGVQPDPVAAQLVSDCAAALEEYGDHALGDL